MELKDSSGADDDKYVIFKQDDLFAESFPLMKEIRRQGKLCDVTLNVNKSFPIPIIWDITLISLLFIFQSFRISDRRSVVLGSSHCISEYYSLLLCNVYPQPGRIKNKRN